MVKFGKQIMSKARMQDGRQIQTIKTVLISEDDFLSDCRINETLEEMRRLRSNLSLLRNNVSRTFTISLSEEQQKILEDSSAARKNVSRTFTISLSEEQQKILEDSSAARNLRNPWKKIIKFENLLKMVCKLVK